MSRFSALLLLVVVAGIPLASAQAASFKVGTTEQRDPLPESLDYQPTMPCNVRLSGAIEAGDLDRLKATLPGDTHMYNGNSLCLDSLGGSFDEGIRIAAFLVKAGVWTVIEPEAKCFSACALIFMAGSSYFEGNPSIARQLHARGRLGFHAPYLSGLPAKDYKNSDIEQTFRAAIRAMRMLMQFSKGLMGEGDERRAVDKNIMPADLVAELLERGPNELYEITTVEQAIKFRISVYGIGPTAMTEKTFCHVCANQALSKDLNWGSQCTELRRHSKQLVSVTLIVYGGARCVFKHASIWGRPKAWLIHSDFFPDGAKLPTDDKYWPILPLWHHAPETTLKSIAR
jgi:hypothetical protein